MVVKTRRDATPIERWTRLDGRGESRFRAPSASHIPTGSRARRERIPRGASVQTARCAWLDRIASFQQHQHRDQREHRECA